MRVIADLQIHSKFSRACSQDLVPGNIAAWADRKGIGIMGTGDFTHPGWMSLLKAELEEARPGLYRHKSAGSAHFMLTAEVSNIYKQGDKVRRIHNMIFAPNFGAVDRIITGLEKAGANLKADGRPIMGIHCDDLVKIVKEADGRAEVIPAHAWTPHFGLFGSLSGFDSIEEAFKDQSRYIFAIETGLSSDPEMNWRISSLDNLTLVSNSDAHSLRKIGREANVFEMEPEKMSYDEVVRIIRGKDPKEFLYTIEFFPEEGKYHLDGHRDCKFSCMPERTRQLGGVCPVCGKKLLVGVLSRVGDLADPSRLRQAEAGREGGFVPPRSVPFKNVIPLEEVIAETLEVGTGSRKVLDMYNKMTDASPEFQVLLEMGEGDIAKISTSEIARSVMRVREGKVHVEGGYDGVFGKIHIYPDTNSRPNRQSTLF